MIYPSFFNPINTLNLFGLKNDFQFLNTLYKNKNFPKVLLLTGNKGVGKSTLINHFLFNIFDNNNYDENNLMIKNISHFYNLYTKDLFPNIISIKGSDYKTVKIEDIRELKNKIYKSTILNKDRFIVLDDIELFNINSMNALLKIIEEPSNNNFFILINNKTKPILETIKSRSLEVKIFLDDKKRLEIINNLVSLFNIQIILDPNLSKLSPGNFVKYDFICNEFKIDLLDDFVKNLTFFLDLFKKKKDPIYINIIFFIADFYFNNLLKKKIMNSIKIIELKNFIFDNLSKFLKYNLSHNSLINSISDKLKYG